MDPQDQSIFCIEFTAGARCIKVPGARCGVNPCAIVFCRDEEFRARAEYEDELSADPHYSDLCDNEPRGDSAIPDYDDPIYQGPDRDPDQEFIEMMINAPDGF
jgi:hypothetical protein